MTEDDEPTYKAQESVDQLMDYLEDIEEAHGVREHRHTVDFTVGDIDLWPKYTDDDEIQAIRSSSVSFGGMKPRTDGKAKQGNPQTGSNIHFPPGREELWEELEEEASFSDKFYLANGSFQLGSLLPPPDGICTPHLLIVEDATVEEVIEAVDEIFRLYETVYEGGDRVIKKNPEQTND